jgi:hypothetical protein
MDANAADALANRAREAMAIPENSRQHPILLYKPPEMAGTLGHLRPFIGNTGTTPPIELPDSHNAGDFGQFLIGADHDWGLPTRKLSVSGPTATWTSTRSERAQCSSVQ